MLLVWTNFIKLKQSLINERSVNCVWWKIDSENEGFWTSEGCEYKGYDTVNNRFKCKCNHTTNFAILFVRFYGLYILTL